MDLDLDGRLALVTGASRGIGRAVAQCLLDEGATVAGCARHPISGDVERLRCWQVDVADGDALSHWVDDAGGWLGGIDIVVHSASAQVPGTSEKAFRANLDTDVLGLARLARAAEPFLAASGIGCLVAIGTISAVEQFGRGVHAYSSLKAAAINYVSVLSHTWAPKGIRANSVSPGPILINGGSWDLIRDQAPDLFVETLAGCPFGRLGTADEVARVVAFLASPAASWISGENIVVDGVYTRRVAF